MVTSYAVLDSSGRYITHVLWDGMSDWQPPDGCTAVSDPDRLYAIPVGPEPEADWLGFSEALLTNPAFQKVRGAAAQDVAVMAAYSDLGWQLNRASAGIVNAEAINVCFWNLFASLGTTFALSAEERQGLVDLMTAFGIHLVVTLP